MTDDTKRQSQRPSIPLNMHPTRMVQVAQSIATRADASDEVRTLAAMVAALSHQLDQVSATANRASTLSRRARF